MQTLIKPSTEKVILTAELLRRGYALHRVEIFPEKPDAPKDPRGVAIVKNRGKLYTCVMWIRGDEWLFGEPVYFGPFVEKDEEAAI